MQDACFVSRIPYPGFGGIFAGLAPLLLLPDEPHGRAGKPVEKTRRGQKPPDFSAFIVASAVIFPDGLAERNPGRADIRPSRCDVH
jgi:hypothetical protein